MPAPTTHRRRLCRAVAFVGVLTASAALAHALAGGVVPRPAVLAGAAATLAVPGWWLGGHERSARTLALAALAGQGALHIAFALAMPGGLNMAGMLCGQQTGPAQPGLLVLHGQPASALTGGAMALMMAAHVVGGIFVLLGLHSAESLASAVAHAMRAAVRRLRRPGAVAISVRRPPVSRRAPALPSTALLLAAAPRRGPPVLAGS